MGSKLAVRVVLVDRTWKFMIAEIAGQLSKQPDEVLLSYRNGVEARFLARVDGVSAAVLSTKASRAAI